MSPKMLSSKSEDDKKLPTKATSKKESKQSRSTEALLNRNRLSRRKLSNDCSWDEFKWFFCRLS